MPDSVVGNEAIEMNEIQAVRSRNTISVLEADKIDC